MQYWQNLKAVRFVHCYRRYPIHYLRVPTRILRDGCRYGVIQEGRSEDDASDILWAGPAGPWRIQHQVTQVRASTLMSYKKDSGVSSYRNWVVVRTKNQLGYPMNVHLSKKTMRKLLRIMGKGWYSKHWKFRVTTASIHRTKLKHANINMKK